ncbi:MAG: large conductance mechanosensitive channel protein MscL [Actinomycetota bacterium]
MEEQIKEFKSFVLRGNPVDLAVGIVVGTAFHDVVRSLVTNVLTPLLGLVGVGDFRDLSFRVGGGAQVELGVFLNSFVSFLLIATTIYFFVVKPVQKLMALYKTGRKEESTTRDCPHCLSAIAKRATRCPFCTSEVPARTS